MTNQIIETILERIIPSDFIGKYITLTKKGKNFMGLCPFHQDKNPSLSVNNDKKMFKCFSCQEGGNVIHFYSKFHKVEWKEAFKILAKEAHIPFPTNQSKNQNWNTYIEYYEEITKFYEHSLQVNQTNRPYHYLTQERKLTNAIMQKFRLGYATASSKSSLHSHFKHYPKHFWDFSGLTRENTTSKNHYWYDFFQDRIIFPIINGKNQVIGFGGRTLNTQQPKYLNSKETSLFYKRDLIYGLWIAKPVIMKTKQTIMVEGYMDVIAMHQHGLENTVGTMGTALTKKHIKEIQSICSEVILFFDQDTAGKKATDRAILLCLEAHLTPFIFAPSGGEGLDPWNISNQFGEEKLQHIIEKGKMDWREYYTYLIDLIPDVMKKKKEFDHIQEKLKQISPLFKSEFLKAFYKKKRSKINNKHISNIASPSYYNPEYNLLSILYYHPHYIQNLKLAPAFFESEETIQFFKILTLSPSKISLNDFPNLKQCITLQSKIQDWSEEKIKHNLKNIINHMLQLSKKKNLKYIRHYFKNQSLSLSDKENIILNIQDHQS